MINSIFFNGIELHDISMDSLVSMIKDKRLQGGYVVTPNADHFYRLCAGGDQEFIDAYKNATIRVCDSRIVQKLSIFEQDRIRHVVPGSDLTQAIIESDWAKKYKILLVGPSASEVEIIREKFDLLYLQHYSPPMGFISDFSEVKKCIDVIKQSGADIVFLAVGSPQQEVLASLVKRDFPASQGCSSVLICVGASLDFLSGKIARAPSIIQKMHLEWLHRVLSDPKRLFPRYWKNFLWILSYLSKRLCQK